MDALQKLLGQDSPTGFTEKGGDGGGGHRPELGFATRRTNKGNLVITVPAGNPAAK